MTVCPLEQRYGRPEVRWIFSDENRLAQMLRVEVELARAHAALGNIPADASDIIAAKCTIDNVRPERVNELELKVRHDIMGLVLAMSEVCGDAGRYLHLGATSSDILDTAFALQMKEFVPVLRDDLLQVCDSLAHLASQHRDTLMVGRTHGQHALPMTFGLKLAVYLEEFMRHLHRLDEVGPRICTGKMLGAVGTGAAFGESALELQKMVMDALGLGVERGATQVVSRDRHIEFIAYLNNIACTCERFAVEVRNLQRTEIAEVREGFDRRTQVGSSTMAQKMNPVMSENICGLARIVRGLLVPMMESSILWHERDLTNSSAERFVHGHACILTDDILTKTIRLISGLEVDTEAMRHNLELTRGGIMAERVIMELTRRGMGRQDAHELVRRVAVELSPGRDLGTALLPHVNGLLTKEEMDALMEPAGYTGASGDIVDASLARWEKVKRGMA